MVILVGFIKEQVMDGKKISLSGDTLLIVGEERRGTQMRTLGTSGRIIDGA